MQNLMTIKFKVNTKLPFHISEFFHLDAEIIHPNIESFQILSFDIENNYCVAEIFIADVSKDEFQLSIDIKKPSLSVNNHEIEYVITGLC